MLAIFYNGFPPETYMCYIPQRYVANIKYIFWGEMIREIYFNVSDLILHRKGYFAFYCQVIVIVCDYFHLQFPYIKLSSETRLLKKF